jgi:hypothetical protein
MIRHVELDSGHRYWDLGESKSSALEGIALIAFFILMADFDGRLRPINGGLALR